MAMTFQIVGATEALAYAAGMTSRGRRAVLGGEDSYPHTAQTGMTIKLHKVYRECVRDEGVYHAAAARRRRAESGREGGAARALGGWVSHGGRAQDISSQLFKTEESE